MISEKDLKQEKDYLKAVLYVLEKEIQKANVKIDEFGKDVKSDLNYAWDYDNMADDVFWAEHISTV